MSYIIAHEAVHMETEDLPEGATTVINTDKRPIPICDFCMHAAEYDCRTRLGPWAWACAKHFEKHGFALGTGHGQRLVLKSGVRA